MSTDTQKPSEHAMIVSWRWLPTDSHPTRERLARDIDQHAIAPAVAERDKRIAELEAMVREYVEVFGYDGGENLSSRRQYELEAKALALLAKKGQP